MEVLVETKDKGLNLKLQLMKRKEQRSKGSRFFSIKRFLKGEKHINITKEKEDVFSMGSASTQAFP